jgi:hypothetical protein
MGPNQHPTHELQNQGLSAQLGYGIAGNDRDAEKQLPLVNDST